MIVTRAPLRLSLGGGGTDLPSYYSRYGGFILSAAINKYVFIHLNQLSIDDRIRLKYSEAETVDGVDEIRHPLLREALRLTEVGQGIEIASMADVPAGTGLGSSGCFLVSLLTALHAFKREYFSLHTLAEEACHIEIDIVGQPVGKQDQYMAAFGGLTCLEIDPSGQVQVSPVNISNHHLDELRHSLVLFYTGLERHSFAILEEQKVDVEQSRQEVIESLHTTKKLGREIKRALEAGALHRFGELLDLHWQTKKVRSRKISNSNVDRWYDIARENGALGGKLMGAGGGGFFMFYCPNQEKGKLREAMSREGLREMSFDFDMGGAKVLINF